MSLVKAANNIVVQSFGLRRDQNILIFADSGSLPAANLVAEAARRIGVHATIFFIPREFQANFGANESLPLPIEAAIREADAVLSCLSPDAEHLAYRRRVLRSSWSRRVKLAHAPGLTVDILRMADTDYDQVRGRCYTLAAALVLGRQVEILTRDGQGREHRLLAEIAGWDFAPGISDGIIPDGAWANLPPGETFVVPLTGDGEIVINGSMPGLVIGPGEELLLTFEHGRLVALAPDDSPAARHLQLTQIEYAQRNADDNWSNLAEIGFGVNPAVDGLTGISLVDEKKLGTIHIALGDSDALGGKVESSIHCDLVVEHPTVRVDGKLLLADGQWRSDDVQWSPDYRTVALPAGWWESVRDVRRSGVRADRAGDVLERQWNSGPGRWDSMPVGSDATARLAARLYQALPADGERVTREALIEKGLQAGLDQQTVVAVLWIMRLYDLVRVQTSSTRPLGTQMDAEDADSPYSSAHSAPPR